MINTPGKNSTGKKNKKISFLEGLCDLFYVEWSGKTPLRQVTRNTWRNWETERDMGRPSRGLSRVNSKCNEFEGGSLLTGFGELCWEATGSSVNINNDIIQISDILTFSNLSASLFIVLDSRNMFKMIFHGLIIMKRIVSSFKPNRWGCSHLEPWKLDVEFENCHVMVGQHYSVYPKITYFFWWQSLCLTHLSLGSWCFPGLTSALLINSNVSKSPVKSI